MNTYYSISSVIRTLRKNFSQCVQLDQSDCLPSCFCHRSMHLSIVLSISGTKGFLLLRYELCYSCHCSCRGHEPEPGLRPRPLRGSNGRGHALFEVIFLPNQRSPSGLVTWKPTCVRLRSTLRLSNLWLFTYVHCNM